MSEFPILFTEHARQRMLERKILQAPVRAVLQHGAVIEDYPDDTPLPSNLKLGFSENGPLHVVSAVDTANAVVIVITVYIPDPAKWETDWRTRRTT